MGGDDYREPRQSEGYGHKHINEPVVAEVDTAESDGECEKYCDGARQHPRAASCLAKHQQVGDHDCVQSVAGWEGWEYSYGATAPISGGHARPIRSFPAIVIARDSIPAAVMRMAGVHHLR